MFKIAWYTHRLFMFFSIWRRSDFLKKVLGGVFFKLRAATLNRDAFVTGFGLRLGVDLGRFLDEVL